MSILYARNVIPENRILMRHSFPFPGKPVESVRNSLMYAGVRREMVRILFSMMQRSSGYSAICHVTRTAA